MVMCYQYDKILNICRFIMDRLLFTVKIALNTVKTSFGVVFPKAAIFDDKGTNR